MPTIGSLLAANGLAGAPPEEKPVSVAVVDDHAVSRTLLARLLKDIDPSVDVVQFAEPGSALAWLPSASPALIITDYRMPQMDGIEFVKELRRNESTKWTPIILITVLDDSQVKKQALRAGATDFLNKPIDHDECRARCRNLLELSGYQALLREQLAVCNAHIRSLRASTGLDSASHTMTATDALQDDRYVLMDYGELYEITSTLAAIDRMLQSWRRKRSSLEAAVNRPLQGLRSDEQ